MGVMNRGYTAYDHNGAFYGANDRQERTRPTAWPT